VNLAKYRKAIASALALLVATVLVALTGGDAAGIETMAVALSGIIGTFLVALLPNKKDDE